MAHWRSEEAMESMLATKHCAACNSQTPKVSAEQARLLLPEVPGFEIDANVSKLVRLFTFKNYYETMAFVNAVAFIAHREDHHPDLEVGYKTCRVTYSTHDVGGLSENDFICAAKVTALLE
jgi:4a-hydroxytetrahydrobiopterin dehydratase